MRSPSESMRNILGSKVLSQFVNVTDCTWSFTKRRVTESGLQPTVPVNVCPQLIVGGGIGVGLSVGA